MSKSHIQGKYNLNQSVHMNGISAKSAYYRSVLGIRVIILLVIKMVVREHAFQSEGSTIGNKLI